MRQRVVEDLFTRLARVHHIHRREFFQHLVHFGTGHARMPGHFIPRRAGTAQKRQVHLGLVGCEAELLKTLHYVHGTTPRISTIRMSDAQVSNYTSSYYRNSKNVSRQDHVFETSLRPALSKRGSPSRRAVRIIDGKPNV